MLLRLALFLSYALCDLDKAAIYICVYCIPYIHTYDLLSKRLIHVEVNLSVAVLPIQDRFNLSEARMQAGEICASRQTLALPPAPSSGDICSRSYPALC